MTTIAYKDGVLVADGRMTQGDTIFNEDFKKITQGPNGHMGGAAGNASAVHAFLAWVKQPDPLASDPPAGEYSGVLVMPEGHYFLYENGAPVGDSISSSLPTALGSGAIAALGAMRAGASPHQAVIAATKTDIYSGGVIRIHRITRKRKT